MIKLQIKLDKLFNALSNCSIFNEMNSCYNNIINNKELKSKIDLYHKTSNSNLRYEIYENEDIKKYKKYETELNLMIMEINNKLNRIIQVGDVSESD